MRHELRRSSLLPRLNVRLQVADVLIQMDRDTALTKEIVDPRTVLVQPPRMISPEGARIRYLPNPVGAWLKQWMHRVLVSNEEILKPCC
jgi:hypothetical protein